jgi:hypothetical protein
MSADVAQRERRQRAAVDRGSVYRAGYSERVARCAACLPKLGNIKPDGLRCTLELPTQLQPYGCGRSATTTGSDQWPYVRRQDTIEVQRTND